MTDEQFETLVARLDEQSRRSPGAYQAKVVALACLGQAYVLTVLLLVFLLFLLALGSVLTLQLIALKLALPLGIFLCMVIKAMWVRIEPPDGIAVTRRQCPELFAIIDDLGHRLGAPRFHHVLVTDDFNAGVVQTPRLGLFGWYRNYLLAGLPLMKALTVEQFTAVLAHEFGHLAKGHGRLSNWIYRLRLRWARLIEALEQTESGGGFLFRPFLGRFVPWFNAWSFPLARVNEYEADATAARLTSPTAAAEALTGVNVIGSFLGERFWPGLFAQADDHAQPRFAPFGSLDKHIEIGLDEDSARAWLAESMRERTTVADTHPALIDRLEAIGASPRLARPAPGGAADRLLGNALPEITKAFDERWLESVGPTWEEHHREVQEDRRRLTALNAAHDRGEPLDFEQAYDRADLTESVGGDDGAALEQFRALHDRAPQNARACFALGARLLARDEEAGAALLEQAIAIDEDATVRSCEALSDYHWRNGREDEAQAWHERLVARAKLEDAARKERDEIRIRDRFDPHGLAEDALTTLRDQLRAVQGLRRAYFVRKRVRHLPHRVCYVLGFVCTPPWLPYRDKRMSAVLERIQAMVEPPSETIIICVDGDNYRFARKLRRVRKARIV